MEWLRAHPYGEQDENGIDISLLRENLKRTPTERIQNNMRAMRLVKEFDRAAEAANRPKDQNHLLELEALRKLKQAEGL